MAFMAWGAMLNQPSYAQYAYPEIDLQLINWMRSNVSEQTGLPYSFYISKDQQQEIYSAMGSADKADNIIERIIVNEGLVIYDGAVMQMAMLLSGSSQDLQLAERLIQVYWAGELGNLHNIRSGYPQFIYNPHNPEEISSSKDASRHSRGFMFRIINADGNYLTQDPLDGKQYAENFPVSSRIHWEDWKPVAGENAWVAMSALQLFHHKYYDEYWKEYYYKEEPVELLLAKELARAAISLQAENGGIRMAPLNTFRESLPGEVISGQGDWWYNQISSENNISWYAAFRMLYEVTGEDIYADAMRGIEHYLKEVYSSEDKYFYQGMRYDGTAWVINKAHFALDVQTWGVACLRPLLIDTWLGEGETVRILRKAFEESGYYDENGKIIGVGFTSEHDRISVEWTAGAILALQEAALYYKNRSPEDAQWAIAYGTAMREGIEFLRRELDYGRAAYSYSSKRGWIPFGWYSHHPDVLSLASTGWVVFNDAGFNPFFFKKISPQLAFQN